MTELDATATPGNPTSHASIVRHHDIDSSVQALRGLDLPDAEIERFEQFMDGATATHQQDRVEVWFGDLSDAVRSGTPMTSINHDNLWRDQIEEAGTLLPARTLPYLAPKQGQPLKKRAIIFLKSFHDLTPLFQSPGPRQSLSGAEVLFIALEGTFPSDLSYPSSPIRVSFIRALPRRNPTSSYRVRDNLSYAKRIPLPA